MGLSNEQKAKKIAKENYIKEVGEAVNTAQHELSRFFTRFQEKAFSLAIKHSETIKQIKEDIEENRELNLGK